MMRTVVLIPAFERDAKAAGLSEEDLQEIVSSIARDPMAGDLMVGTGGGASSAIARQAVGRAAATGRFTTLPVMVSRSS